MSTATQYILTWQCPDNTGVLAKVSQSLFAHGAFITETSQYSDPYSETFFSRIAFDDRNLTVSSSDFLLAIDEIAVPLAMQYQLRKRNDVPNIIIAVSKDDHCLVSLLTKWKSGVLPVNVVAVISNHQDCQSLSEWHKVPFYHLPLSKEATPEKTAESKAAQEAKILALMDKHNIDLLVLARYMQILSNDLCQKLQGKAINIHHSFLPSFKGARPYHQAHSRGVKVIGATAHYVTAVLDEGPIIAQEVKSINHTFTIEQMVHMGHDLEATALSHAVRMHAEQRVCLNGAKTVILA